MKALPTNAYNYYNKIASPSSPDMVYFRDLLNIIQTSCDTEFDIEVENCFLDHNYGNCEKCLHFIVNSNLEEEFSLLEILGAIFSLKKAKASGLPSDLSKIAG